MPDANLALTVQSFTKEQLAIKVKNKGAALDQALQLEITLPKVLLVEKIRAAADRASRISPPIANLDSDVKGAEGKFSVWAEPETSDQFVSIVFFNDLDKGAVEISPMVLEANAEFTILIPLDPAVHHISIELPYGYEYNGKRVDDKLELKGEESSWKPEVTFTTPQSSPTAIPPMTHVIIKWEIKNGVSATLFGPLPGGNTEWSLSDKPNSDYKLSKGSFGITAVSSMTFMLQAEVRDPSGKLPNERVGRIISLDIATTAKHGYIDVRPSRVLPYGLVEFDWAAWGVKSVRIATAGGFREIELTDMSLSGFAQGSGVVRTTAPKGIGEDTKGHLYIEIERTMREAGKPAEYTVVPWTKMEENPKFTGKPVGLAVAVSNMGLLTSDGLWIADVGEFDEDKGIKDLKFTKANTDRPKAWLAIAALGDKFVVLRQTDQNDLQVAIYKSDGTGAGIPPLILPNVKYFIGSGTVFDFAVFRNRAYVAVETGGVRAAFSVGFDFNTRRAEYRNEVLLEVFPGYRLLTFDDALFALNRDSGQMLRFELKEGKLEPYKAASAVNERDASLIKEGLLVPVGRVLAVLSPSSVPSLTSLSGVGLKNVLPYKRNLLAAPQDTSRIPQDLVYNPQTDRWSRCGHGLDLKEAVVAFRGTSQRLWAIDPNGATYTLTGATEDLFLPDFYKGVASKPLPAVFNKSREFLFINNTGMQFVPMNEICFMAGLRSISTTGLVQLTSPLPTGPTNPKMAEPVVLRYNDAETSTITMRFLAEQGRGLEHDYVLEVTLSHANFSFATIGFKRLTVDQHGKVLVVDLPEKLEFPIALGLIETFPRKLGNGINLRIHNTTPYTLWLLSPEAKDPIDQVKKYDPAKGITIRYNTPPFSIYAHGAGELPVEVDFTVPAGFEMSPGSEVQKNRIRIRPNGPLVFESESFDATPQSEAYEVSLRYQVERKLNGAYLGDGVPSRDGASIYVPLAEPPNVTNAKILKIDANNLQTTAQASVVGRQIFSCPNSIAVLSDLVIAIFNREHFNIFDHSLKPQSGPMLGLFEYNIITNLKSPAGNILFFMGMEEHPTWQYRYSYKYDRWSLSPVRHEENGVIDFLKGFRPGRVPGAAPWVSPDTISPMDVRLGAVIAICVEGGIIGYDLKNSGNEIGVELPGTGREHAILVDPTEHLVFSAHSKSSGAGLMISRINIANQRENVTSELPGSITHMVTDPKTQTSPNMEYYRPRAVSLLATPDALFVSHARKIYVLDKTTLKPRQNVQLPLFLRLIQVRRGKAPGSKHPTYGDPPDCYYVWAIGSRYIGDGQTVKADEYGKSYDTALYRIAIPT